jgi:small GTP-binding protein
MPPKKVKAPSEVPALLPDHAESCSKASPKPMRMDNDNVNLCVVGGVSTGKSTVLNALFLETISPTSIKRTTMVPTVYIETMKDITAKEIFAKIDAKNRELIEKSEKGKTVDPADYTELRFEVGKLNVNIADCLFNIYDIPGLNDARTKQIYYDYLKSAIEHFNLILLIIDINSGMNTSDEMDILKFIVKYTKRFKHRNIRTLVVANKADDMQLGPNKTLRFGRDMQEMFDQVESSVKEEFEDSDVEDHLLGVIPLCALDAYLYRMIRNPKPDFELTPAQIHKIGTNDCGKKFSLLDPEEQKTKVLEIVKDDKFLKDVIELSGFSQMERKLAEHLNTTHKMDRVGNIMARLESIDVEGEIMEVMSASTHISSLYMALKRSEKQLSTVKERLKVYAGSIKPIDPSLYQESMMELFQTLRKYAIPFWTHGHCNFGYDEVGYCTDVITNHPTRNRKVDIQQCSITFSMMWISMYLSSFNGFRSLITESDFVMDFCDEDYFTTEEKRNLFPTTLCETIWAYLKDSFPHHKCAYGLNYCIDTMQIIGYFDIEHVKILIDSFFDPSQRTYDPTLPWTMYEHRDINATRTLQVVKRIAPFVSKEFNEQIARHIVVVFFQAKEECSAEEITIRRMMYVRRGETCVRLLMDLIKKVDYRIIIEGWKAEYETDPRFELDLYYLSTLETSVKTQAPVSLLD